MTTSIWERSGPVVVEVDGRADGLRVVDYAVLEALRTGAQLRLVAPYQAHSSFSPMTPGYQPKPPAEGADAALREAVAHLHHRYGFQLDLEAVAVEGARGKVLAHAARGARLLVVGRIRARGPHRLIAAQANLQLAGRAGCPVVVVPLSWRPGLTDRKVAVGIDGSRLSSEALEFAFREAAERSGDLIVLHAGDEPRTPDRDDSWISRADHTMSAALREWSDEFPQVKVTRFLTGRPAVAALVRESQEVGLVVVGCHVGPLPIADPVARRAVAAMTSPVAIVPHHLTEAEVEHLRRSSPAAAVAPMS